MKILESYLGIAKSLFIEAEIDDEEMIKYKDKDGESKEMKAGSAKTMAKDHPAKIEYDRMVDKGGEEEPKGKGLGKGDFERDFDDGEPEDKPHGGDTGKDADFKGEPPEGAREPDDEPKEKSRFSGAHMDDVDDSLRSLKQQPKDDIKPPPELERGVAKTIEKIESGTMTDEDLEWAKGAHKQLQIQAGYNQYLADMESDLKDALKKADEPEGGEPEGGGELGQDEYGNVTGTAEQWKSGEHDEAAAKHYEDYEIGIDYDMAQAQRDDKQNERWFEDGQISQEKYEEKHDEAAADMEQALAAKRHIEKQQGGKEESITINGQKYRPIKESKQRTFKEIYDRTFRSLK